MIIKEVWKPRALVKNKPKNSIINLISKYEYLSESVLSLNSLIMRRADLELLTPNDYKKLLLTTPSSKHKPELDKAVKIISEFTKDQRPILVWGDYDVDGMTATASLFLALSELDRNVKWFIPNRTLGYGLNVDKVLEIFPEKSLIVTVDTGIAENEEIAKLKELGYTVVVTDHHLPQEELPKADFILDPKVHLTDQDAEYMVSGCFVGAQVGLELIKLFKPERYKYFKDMFSCFISFSIMSDIIELNKEIRVQLDYGLICLNKVEHDGLRALLSMCGMKVPHEVTSTFVSYSVTPKLNAAGRMDNVQAGMDALLCMEDESFGKSTSRIHANNLRSLNNNRKIIESQIFDQIVDEIREEVPPAIVVYGKDYPAGIVGIAASRLVDRYHVPALVLTGEEVIHGSGRAPESISLFDTLKACEDLLIQFGGHKVAAGLALKPENLEAFKQKFIETVKATHTSTEHIRYIDAEVNVENLYDIRFQSFLSNIEPVGNKNEPINLMLSNVTVVAIKHRGEVTDVVVKDAKGFTSVLSKFRAYGYDKYLYKQVDIMFNGAPSYYTGYKIMDWRIVDIRLFSKI